MKKILLMFVIIIIAYPLAATSTEDVGEGYEEFEEAGSVEIYNLCGNGFIDEMEECDPKAKPVGCEPGKRCDNCKCLTMINPMDCGNGMIDAGEECGEPELSCDEGFKCRDCRCKAK